MPYYKITGTNRRTGKPAVVSLRAKSESTASKKANREYSLRVDRVEQVQVWCFTCHVAGTSHGNRDGSNRQAILKNCGIPETVWLEHETNNRHDKHAIRVIRADRSQIGYVPQDTAVDIIDGFHAVNGCKCCASLVDVFPFDEDTDLLTGDLAILVAANDTSGDQIRDFLSSAQLPDAIRSALPLAPLPMVEIDTHVRPKRKPTTKQNQQVSTQTGCLLLIALVPFASALVAGLIAIFHQ